MELEVKGIIAMVGETVEGASKDGKPYQKLIYTIDTGEQYDNIVAFEIFGQDKVEQFRKYNVVGDDVTVKFNIKCNEWKGKYFTTLSSWRCVKNNSETPQNETVQAEAETEDLPF